LLRPRIIPCLLVKNGGLVKTQRFAEPKYVGDPINAVKIFNEKEVDELIVVDIDGEKLAAARQAGADHTINSKDEDALERLKELTGNGPGAIVDFVGNSETTKLGYDAVRKGGRYIGVGLYGGEITIPTLTLPIRNMTLRGSYVGRLEEMKELIELVRGGKVTPIPVETRPMERVTETLQDLLDGRILGRVVLVP